MAELLDFTDRHVVITGAATGIGAATTELLLERGATVHAIDIAPVQAAAASTIEADLGNADSVGKAVAQLPAAIDVLMNCAGVPNGGRFSGEEVMRINWLGLRLLTESVIERMQPGSSVVHVASTAGRGWPNHVDELRELADCGSFDDGVSWVQQHSGLVGDGYALSKEAVQWYTMTRALETRPMGIRMNSICPGVTNTQLTDDFRRGVGTDVLDRAAQVAGRMAEPAEMAPPMLFLADEASASYVNGLNLNVDSGTGAAHMTGSF